MYFPVSKQVEVLDSPAITISGTSLAVGVYIRDEACVGYVVQSPDKISMIERGIFGGKFDVTKYNVCPQGSFEYWRREGD